MTAFILDASVGVKLVIPEDDSPLAEALLATDPALWVPDLFFIECANVLWKRMRGGTYPLQVAIANLVDLRHLDLATVSTSELMTRALEIAHLYGVTAYDGCYVALSEQKGLPLVTADARLRTRLEGSAFQVRTLVECM
jgi:predicted nucleic acid-binding protein